MAKKKVNNKVTPQKSSPMKLVLFLGIIAVVVLILVFFFSGKPKYQQEDVETLAKCLTEKGTVMYGAYWCPHCARTKARFGEAFRYVTYVECDPKGDNARPELCIEKKIDKYDTWEFADGTFFVSEPSFELLAERSGCVAPELK
jgi:hypothetical protein